MQLRTEKQRQIAISAALCLAFSMLEYAIPKPLPFLKLGLANLPLLLSLSVLSWPEYLALVLLKIVGSALVGGTLLTPVFLIVASGGLASALAMKGAHSLLSKYLSPVGYSVLGAFASNIVKLWMADILIYGQAIWIAAPLLLGIGLASGILLGIVAAKSGGIRAAGAILDREESAETAQAEGRKEKRILFSLVLASFLVAAFAKDIPVLAALCAAALCAQAFSGRTLRPTPYICLVLSLLACSLFVPSGRILWSWKALRITDGALRDAAVKSLRIVSFMALSQISSAYPPRIPGSFFRLLSTSLSLLSRIRVVRSGSVFVIEEKEAGKTRPSSPKTVSAVLLFGLAAVVILSR